MLQKIFTFTQVDFFPQKLSINMWNGHVVEIKNFISYFNKNDQFALHMIFISQLQQTFLFIQLWDGLTLGSKQSGDGRNMNLSLCPLRRHRAHLWTPYINWRKKSREAKPEA